MESSCRKPLFLVFPCFFLCFSGAEAYKNYTVGDSLGWYDKLLKPAVDYQKWAAGKNFSLGDFLIFNTDMNHTVVQTYNATTYKRCNYQDAEEDDTIEWSSGEPSAAAEAVSVAVPLLKEGATYFFSGDYDGEQCKHGQHFKINVTHGQGLPNSLKDAGTTDAPRPAAADDSTPDTVIPSNFNNPVDAGEGDAAKPASGSCINTPWFRALGRFGLGLLSMAVLWVFG